MTLSILSIGTAVPDALVSQDEAREITRALCRCTSEQESWLPQLFRHSGIGRRHLVMGRQVVRDILDGTRLSGSVCLPRGVPGDPGPSTRERMQHYEWYAGSLALTAARQALTGAAVAPQQITHLITVSCTGFHAPGADCELIEGLGLPRGVNRTHIGFMGCHGALNALRVARAFAAAEPAAHVLLCDVELCSLHFCYRWDPSRVVANALFADGAAALVGAAGGGPWRVAANGSFVFPGSADAMTWLIGDHGFEMALSKKVPGLIAGNLRPWLTEWLASLNLRLGDVGSWAIHPGGPRILSAVEESLPLRPEATRYSRDVLADFGNMSSPTVLFILDRLRDRRAQLPCVALAFGPGLTAEAALLL
jgi:predicted naringenin-chalcone synthase